MDVLTIGCQTADGIDARSAESGGARRDGSKRRDLPPQTMDPFLLRLIDELNFLADVLTEIESPALDLPGHHGADGIEANATSTGHGAASSSVPSW